MPSRRLFAFAFGLSAAVLVPRLTAGSDGPFQTMGRYVQQSALITLVNAKVSDSPDDQAVLEFGELLTGRADPVRKAIAVKWSCLLRGGSAAIIPGTAGAAILLAEGWQQAECPVLAVYQKPQEIAALRTLTRIYALPSERSRLEALRALVNDPNPLFRDQLFDDLRQMREPANFQIILDLFDVVDAAGRRNVVQLLEAIGDIRGVPILLKALTSLDPSLRVSAEATLSTYFRSAPGVDEALRQAGKNVLKAPETRFQAAARLWEGGQQPRGRALFLAVAQDKSESDYVRVQSALTLAPTLSQSERTTLQMAMRPLLARLVEKGNYLELLDVARILRALRSAENLDLLMALLDRTQADFVSQDTPCIATLAIRDLGPLARRTAGERLLTRVEMARTERMAGEPALQLLALAWLGNGAQLETIEERRWSVLRPLLGVGDQQDEGLFLMRALQNHPDLPPLAVTWIAYRLGDLREKRSVPDLIRLLTTSYANPDTWHALVQIAGPVVESEAARLLTHPRPDVRSAAIDILYHLQGAKMLPLLRRMLVEKDLGVKSHALLWIGHVGEPADLKRLVPMADSWTGDRENHYWAMLAVAEIQRRHDK